MKHSTVPAGELFWAMLPGERRVRRPGPLPDGLWPDVEQDIPVGSEILHGVCAPLRSPGDGKQLGLLVCAAPRSVLESADPALATLTPRSLPDFVRPGTLDPRALNLLVGPFEPRPVRTRRARVALRRIAALVAVCTLLCVGLHRRASAWSSEAKTARVAIAELGAGLSSGDLRSREQHLSAAVEDARRASPSPDALAPLAQLLRSFPTDLAAEVHELRATGTTIAIAVSVAQDSAGFLRALRPPPGWTTSEPRLHASAGLIRLSVEMLAPPAGGRP